jgi:hypothetical protein
MLIVLAASRETTKTPSSQLGNRRLKFPAKPCPVTIPIRAHIICTAAISGQVRSAVLKKTGPMLRARNRIGGDAGWVIVGRPGDDARAQRSQEQSHPSNWGKYRRGRVGTDCFVHRCLAAWFVGLGLRLVVENDVQQ